MTCESCATSTDIFGADPARVQWKIVRGDSSSLRIQFLEDDEITPIDITGWTFISTAYNQVLGDTEILTVVPAVGYVDIFVTPLQSSSWGSSYATVVAELPFDLQVTKPDDTIWTPVIGTICVLGDITGGSL